VTTGDYEDALMDQVDAFWRTMCGNRVELTGLGNGCIPTRGYRRIVEISLGLTEASDYTIEDIPDDLAQAFQQQTWLSLEQWLQTCVAGLGSILR
jgi:hypothetical protein